MTKPLAETIANVFHDAAKGAAVRLGLDVDPSQLAAGVDDALARPYRLDLLMRCGSRLNFETSLKYCLAFEAGLLHASQQGMPWYSDEKVSMTVRPSDVTAIFRTAVPATPEAAA